MDEIKAWSRFSESLDSLRTEEKADFMLQCGDIVFYAHRIVLEASSVYFAAMFNSGLLEAKTGKIVFEDVGSFTLECILDFIYKKKVDNMNTETEIKNVLIVSHMLALDELFQYCCEELIQQMSKYNFFEIFEIGNCYKVDTMITAALQFWVENARELAHSNDFLMLSFPQVKNLLVTLKSNLLSLNCVLFGVLRWLKHDVDGRTQFIPPIFEHIDTNLVTKKCIKEVFKQKDLVTSSEAVANSIKELGLEVFITDNYIAVPTPQVSEDVIGKHTYLIFFSRHRNVEVYHPDQNCNVVKRVDCCKCFQQCDLSTREWLPVRKINFSSYQAVCQLERCLYLVGGRGRDNLVYDVESGTLLHEEPNVFCNRDNAGMCFFNGYIYFIGGYEDHKIMKSVHYSKPGSAIWLEAEPLVVFPSYPIVLASNNYVYVVTFTRHISEICIQYNAAPDKMIPWNVIFINNSGIHLYPINFFVYQNRLQALYIADDDAILLTLDDQKCKMNCKHYHGVPEGLTRITRVNHCYCSSLLQVCLVGGQDWFHIPNFSWNPENGEWLKRHPTTGTCELPYIISSMEYVF